MSLVANPKVEFLDEPTTGVDPVSRRSLFKMLKNLQDSSLVLTTHRMDEAESLCDNIAIMVNGRFVVYGSPGHLKDQYGQGYLVTMKPKIPEAELNSYVTQNLPYLEKQDVGYNSFRAPDGSHEIQYQVKADIALDSIGGLSQIFQSLTNMRYQDKIITDFSVTRSSLEQVFI